MLTHSCLSRLSLMTFPMQPDFQTGSLSEAESIEIASESALPYVDLLNVPKNKVAVYRDALYRNSVRVSCYIASISLLDEIDRIRARLTGEMETAAALSAPMFMIVPYEGAATFRKALTLPRAEIKKYMMEGYRMAVALGRKFGLRICLETTPHDILCLSGSDDLLELLTNVPELGLVFDTANMLPHGEDPFAAYQKLKERIIHVHLKDVRLAPAWKDVPDQELAADGRRMEAVLPGEGVIPVKKLWETMLRDGYSGLFALEYVRPCDEACDKAGHLAQVGKFTSFYRE